MKNKSQETELIMKPRQRQATEITPDIELKYLSNVADNFLRGDGLAAVDFLASIGPVLDPRFDLLETPDRFTLFADLPGLRRDDLDIELQGRSLTVVGERKLEAVADPNRYLVIERSCGTFCRTFRLPAEVEVESADVTVADGVLKVDVPKQGTGIGGN